VTTPLLLATCALAGVVIGSFLTVVVDRVPRGGSVIAPPSACGACGTRLRPADLVPIASWVVLRGRCRHCGAAIGVEPVAIEVATAAVFVTFGVHFGASVMLVPYCILGAALVALSWVDLREQRLPREISYPAAALGSAALVIVAVVEAEPRRIAQMVLGALIATALLGGIHLASRGGIGDGDVRMAPLIGVHLGWLNPGIVPVGLFFGFLAGAIVAVALLVTRLATRTTPIPFGPFLALGTIAGVLWGQAFIDALLAR